MVHLHDWLTTPQIPFASKTTDTADHYLHDHDFFEIFYITKGSASHILNGERYTVQTGDLFYLNPEDAHCFLKDEGEYCAHRDIVLRRSFFKEICDFISPVLYNDYTENKLNKILRLSDAKLKNFETVFEKLSALPAVGGDIIMANARITLTELIGLLINSQSEAYFQRPIWLEKLLLRFNDPQLLKEGLDSLASDFFYSKEHVCRTFKKYLGVTMTDYLNEKRLEAAANALVYSNKRILDVSNDLGFCSVSYFNKIFKQKYNLSPSAFRRTALAERPQPKKQ